MGQNDLWKKFCSGYETDFSTQFDDNEKRMEQYFEKWRKTDLAKIILQGEYQNFRTVPITKYDDYFMLNEFGDKIEASLKRNPKQHGELNKYYYDRICNEIEIDLDKYMTEPLLSCMKTTGTSGQNKWIAFGETFWKNFYKVAIAGCVISCSDGWGETKVNVGDKGLNVTAPIPYISGWGAWASKDLFGLVPPIELADNVNNMREKFNLMFKAIKKGEKIAMGGGIGSMFYMICKYFVDPEEFYADYYHSMNFSLRKILLSLLLLKYRLSRKEAKKITDFLPLKGVMVAGVEAKLYIEFFKSEFNFEPLHAYGSTEAGVIMRGDPDRKTELVPDLTAIYLEFLNEEGELKDLTQLKKGEIYDVVVTPFGSILYRYDMEDLVRVVDFRDDGMPIFEFEGRKRTVVRLYSWYRVTPNVIVKALHRAGLKTSDKWSVTKLLKPKEHLHFLIEKTWPLSERDAEKLIFKSLVETDIEIPHRGHTLSDYLNDFRVKAASDLITVEYLRPGAFLRYTINQAKMGAPLGQYKPPKIIPTEKMEIFDTLRHA